jgi:hypothetical protein
MCTLVERVAVVNSTIGHFADPAHSIEKRYGRISALFNELTQAETLECAQANVRDPPLMARLFDNYLAGRGVISHKLVTIRGDECRVELVDEGILKWFGNRNRVWISIAHVENRLAIL